MKDYSCYAGNLYAVLSNSHAKYRELYDVYAAEKKINDDLHEDLRHTPRAPGNARYERILAQVKQSDLDLEKAANRLKTDGAQVWKDFDTRRTQLTKEFHDDIEETRTANSDDIDNNALTLLRSGVMKPADYTAMAEKFSDNPTMLRMIGQQVTAYADKLPDTDSNTRGQLRMLASNCESAEDKKLKEWDGLVQTTNYMSGRGADGYRRLDPDIVTKMGEKLPGMKGGFDNF